MVIQSVSVISNTSCFTNVVISGHRRTGTIRPGEAVSFLPEKITQCLNA